MTPFVPKKTAVTKPGQLFEELSDLLFSALEFIGATAGWIGVQESGGGLTYPVRAGAFSESWVPWQQNLGGVWGLAVDDRPTLLNDLQPWSKLVAPPLRNLLSCPLIHNGHIRGHVVLANKAHGFIAQDSVVLQGFAHHMARLLGRYTPVPSVPIQLPAPWRRVLDRADDAVLVLDENGVLIYTNAAWLAWTGFRAEELLGQSAPFPFWVSPNDLVRALSLAAGMDANLLPFRRCDHSLLWCRIETVTERWNERAVTVAFLQMPAQPPRPTVEREPSAAAEQPPKLQADAQDWLPLLLDLDDGIEGWCIAWEERTGLSAKDVEGVRGELMLDWLFPQQHDRNRVADCFHQPRSTGCQLVLEVVSAHGSRPMLCTFLSLPAGIPNVSARRWLLLAGECEQTAEKSVNNGSAHDDPPPLVGEAVDKTEPRP